MKLKQKPQLITTKNGMVFANIEIPTAYVDELNKIMKYDDVTVEIAKTKVKRSLNANAALWLMLSRLAEALDTTDHELYIKALIDYGVSDFIIVKPEAVEMVKRQFKAYEDFGEVNINGKTGIQLKVYYGSSTYNSKQFARLLDGVIQDAKESDIEFISTEERNSIMNNYKEV